MKPLGIFDRVISGLPMGIGVFVSMAIPKDARAMIDQLCDELIYELAKDTPDGDHSAASVLREVINHAGFNIYELSNDETDQHQPG
jgi:hypothetical protein